MVHIHYDFGLVLGSIITAFLICYLAVSIEQLLFRGLRKKYQKILLVVNGFVFAAAIWCMHFVGMLGYNLPINQTFDKSLTLLSYIIAFVASTFAIWLTTRSTLSLTRLMLGAVLMGFGISGMHYTGMMALAINPYKIEYNLFLTVLSVVIAVCGSALTFRLIFQYKHSVNRLIYIKALIALMMALTIVGMHYTGMMAVSFHFLESEKLVPHYQTGNSALLLTVIIVASLVLLAALSLAILEQRLELRSKQLFRANRDLADQLVQDNLTKLPNRLFLAEYSHALFARHRQHQEKIAFLYIDLDHFKVVNDVFGHHVGDQLLLQLATRIHPQMAGQEKLLRIGSDEFLMVLEKSNTEDAIRKAEQILALTQEQFMIAGKDINISSSIGIAMYPDHGNNLQDLLINADAAMFVSKYQGRNTYSVFNYSVDQQETKSQTRLINDLYKAVEEKQFMLFYQPKFNTQKQEICGVEALIRWNHPSLGRLTPNKFIDSAEKTGLIIQMGYWALEQACKQIKIWEDKGYHYFPIAVNLSAVQFEHKHLFSTLENLFEKYQICPHHLAIEITESTAMHQIDASIRCLERLGQMGIKLAIDDFGTGHSSFLYLKNLPVDELKIDQGFIRNLSKGSKDELILESIIQLAIKLGLVVTAEGVETALQAEILTRLGCQQLQGYLLGMPMEVEALEQSNYNLPHQN